MYRTKLDYNVIKLVILKSYLNFWPSSHGDIIKKKKKCLKCQSYVN